MPSHSTTLSLLAGLLAALAPLPVHAWDPPAESYGLKLQWASKFPGAANSLPNEDHWSIANANYNVNNEKQFYLRDPRVIRTTGNGTLQIIPRKEWREGQPWISGRIESKYTFTPQPGKVTAVESRLRFGNGAAWTRMGIWPAFWMLGRSIGQVGWPACGEIDIMENVNAQMTGHGTVHCPGCKQGGVGNAVGLPGSSSDWRTWRVVIDRAAKPERITFSVDGNEYFSLTSDSDRLNWDAWKALAQSPLFIILNVAVGGNWPGPPNDSTQGGEGSMMEVGYVAHYAN